jgi:hypothetical protein
VSPTPSSRSRIDRKFPRLTPRKSLGLAASFTVIQSYLWLPSHLVLHTRLTPDIALTLMRRRVAWSDGGGLQQQRYRLRQPAVPALRQPGRPREIGVLVVVKLI